MLIICHLVSGTPPLKAGVTTL